jgi:hypothetical protein
VRNADTGDVIGIVSVVGCMRDRRGDLSMYLPCFHLYVVRNTDTGDAIEMVSVVGWRMTHSGEVTSVLNNLDFLYLFFATMSPVAVLR